MNTGMIRKSVKRFSEKIMPQIIRQGSLRDERDGSFGERPTVPCDRVAVPADGGIQAGAEIFVAGPGGGVGSTRTCATRVLLLARRAAAAGVVAAQSSEPQT